MFDKYLNNMHNNKQKFVNYINKKIKVYGIRYLYNKIYQNKNINLIDLLF